MRRFLIISLLLLSTTLAAQNDFLIAENYYRQGEYKKAAQLYEGMLKKNPFNTSYLKRLVTCYQETDQFDKAENLLRKTLASNPSQQYLHVEIGYNYARQQKAELAKKEYDNALKAIETKPSLGGITGSLFRQNNLLDYAVSSYTRTMELNKNSNYEFQIAQIYGEKGEFEKMFNSYVSLIDRNEGYISTVQRYASRFITDNPSDKNNVALKKALLRKSISNPKDVWNELLSWLFAKQKDYGKALIQEKALFRRNPEYLENIVTLGKIAFEDSDFNAAKDCFSFLLANTNFIDEKINAELYLLKIALALEQENIDSLYEKAFKTYGINANTVSIQVSYADYLTFQKNDPKKAEDILEKAMSFAKSKFQKARIKLKLGDVLVFTERFNKALIYFSQVQTQLKNHPLSQEARFKVAQTSYFKGDFKWAMAQLKVLKGSTTQLIANDAVDLFLKISDNEPQDSIPTGLTQFAKADLLSYQNKNKEAISIYSGILKQYKGQEIEDETLYNQALLYVEEKEYELAISNLLNLVDLNKEGVFVDDAYFKLAKIYEDDIKNPEKAKEYYQKIIFEKASSIYLVEARKKFRQLRGDTIN